MEIGVGCLMNRIFLSTLSLRRATSYQGAYYFTSFPFLSTLSLRRATAVTAVHHLLPSYFYPRSPCGERPWVRRHKALPAPFLSTLSLRRATGRSCFSGINSSYFYPRSPCGERLTVPDLGKRNIRISIHALLAESDPGNSPVILDRIHFYPRSPCGERREFNVAVLKNGVFLSTLSLRRAT